MGRIIDKFIKEYSAEPIAEERFRILMEIINLYYDSDFNQINVLLKKELELSIQTANIDGEALIRYMFAYSAFEKGDFKNGEEQVKYVMSIFPRVTNHEVRAQVFNFMAFMYSHQGQYEKAFEHCYECIREAELSGNKKNQFWGSYSLGVLHFDLKDFSNAEKYYTEAAKGFSKYGNEYGVARSETGLSSIYIQQEKYLEAEELLNRSLKYYKEVEVTSGQSRSLNDLGVIYRKTGKYETALECLIQSLHIRKETKHAQGIATSLNEIADLLIILEKYKEAEKYLFEAKELCESIHNKGKLFRSYFLFSQLYRNINEPWKALEYYEHYDKLKSEVQGETANNKIKALQTRMATEKSEREAEIERLKNVELKTAYDLISDKNKEILDSIHYAKRIQNSLLPTHNYIEKSLARLQKR